MKLRIIALGVLATALCSLQTLHAQIIWDVAGPKTISGPSDISTLGTFVDAITPHAVATYGNTAEPSTLTVGDSKFNIGSTSDSFISLTSNSGVGDGGDGNAPDGFNGYESLAQQPTPPSSTDSKNYNELLTHCAYSGGTVTVTMSNLTLNRAYQVEIWNSAGRQTTYTSSIGGDSVILTGNDYITGAFTALTSSESFTFIQSGGNNLGVISDIEIRAVPEPSTYGAMALGLLALAGVTRLRKLAA